MIERMEFRAVTLARLRVAPSVWNSVEVAA